MKGYAEALAFALQPAQTTPSILNTVFLDPATNKFRLAQRSGVDLYDLFNFNTNSSTSIPTVVLPGNGGNGTASIQIPLTGCAPFTFSTQSPTTTICNVIGGTYAVNTSSGVITITPTAATNGTCQPVSLILCSQPNNSSTGTSTGNFNIGGPGGYHGAGGQVPFTQPPCTHCAPIPPPPNNTSQQWIACYPCSEYGGNHPTGPSFWVNQSVIGSFNALPSFQDNNSNFSTYLGCFYASGLRSAIPGDVRTTATTGGTGGLVWITDCGHCSTTGSNCCAVGICNFNLGVGRLQGHIVLRPIAWGTPDCSGTPGTEVDVEFDFDVQMDVCGGRSSEFSYVRGGLVSLNPDNTPTIKNVLWQVNGVDYGSGEVDCSIQYNGGTGLWDIIVAGYVGGISYFGLNGVGVGYLNNSLAGSCGGISLQTFANCSSINYYSWNNSITMTRVNNGAC